MVRRVSESTGIPFQTALDSVAGVFPKQTELALYRIAQEAINNVVRHSSATQARVELKRGMNQVELVIADNGKGLDATRSNGNGGSGLPGITERARLIGGVAVIESAPGAGTTVAVRIRYKGRNDGERDHHSGSRRSSDIP